MVTDRKPKHDNPRLGTSIASAPDCGPSKTVNYRRCPRHGKSIPIGEVCPYCAAEARRGTPLTIKVSD